jgi:hypothetical protein
MKDSTTHEETYGLYDMSMYSIPDYYKCGRETECTQGPKFNPGDRVLVFDRTLYKNDKDTPLVVTMQPATVIKQYARLETSFGDYENLVDVTFDHDGRVSRGHFGDAIWRYTTE